MGIRCKQAGTLLAARASGIDEADKVRLEAHLDQCSRCRADAGMLDRLIGLCAEPRALRPGQRTRAVRAALTADSAVIGPRRNTRPIVWIAAAAGIMLSGGAAAYLGSHGDSRPDRAADHASPATEPSVAVAETTPAPIATPVVEAPAPETIVASAPTPAPEPAAVVAPAPIPAAGPAAVVARHQPRHHHRSAAAEPPAQRKAVRTRQEQATVAADEHVDDQTVSTDDLALTSAATYLSAARKALAGGDSDTARDDLTKARAAGPDRKLRAEADTLSAEIAMVDGDLGLAAVLFMEVAERYADLPAGENALVAAARVLHASGGTTAARAAWRRYLDRYPEGRFRADVLRRLRN